MSSLKLENKISFSDLLKQKDFLENKQFYYSSLEIMSNNSLDISNKSKSDSVFHGYLIIYYDVLGIIYHYEFQFDSIVIDTFTTASWLVSKNKSYQLREKLFKQIGIGPQKPRPKNNLSNKMNFVQLNKQQIKQTNNFINSNSITFNNVVALFRGSNPSGQIKNKKSGQLLWKQDDKFYNFTIFFQHLFIGSIPLDKTIVVRNAIFANFLTIIPKQIKEMFLNFDISQLKEIKDTLFSYNQTQNEIELLVDKDIQRERQKYTKTIEKNNVSVFKWRKDETEKAHIYSVKSIRQQMEKCKHLMMNEVKQEQKSKYQSEYNKYKSYISNVDNYLNLTRQLHYFFDSNFFSYNKNGEIIFSLEEYTYEVNNKNVDNKITKTKKDRMLDFFKENNNEFSIFAQIQDIFLKEERKKFLELKNSEIHEFKNQT